MKRSKWYKCIAEIILENLYHNNLINTYHKYPQIFKPKYVIKNFFTNKEKLISIMRDNIHPRYPNIAVDKWINLSKELSNYESLINKINTFSNFEELNNFIRNINGYGQKTGGLLLRLIYEANICNFTYELGYIPLDRHDIEISYLNNIIDKRKLSNKEIEELSNLYIASGKKIGIGADFIGKYLWNIGNDFCNKKNLVLV